MSCGGNNDFITKLKQECEIGRDLISLKRSSRLMTAASIDILENVLCPITAEKTHLEEKIWFFQILSRYQMKIADSDVSHLGKPAPIDNNSISKLERISFLNTLIEMASTLVLLFGKRLGMLYKVWKETKDKWELEEPERSRVEKMNRKERKALVKLFKEREMIAAQEKTKFDDLKAEWDAEKGGFDEIVMECLRRVAKLHQ